MDGNLIKGKVIDMRKLTGFMLLLALLTVAAGSCIIARAEAAVSAMAWDFDGRYLAVGKSDGTIEIADMARNQVAQRFKQATRVTAIAWTLDGKSLASAGEDGSVILWDPGQGTRVRQVVQHPYSLRHLFFNRTGTIIFGADSSEIARAYAWDLASGSLLPIFSTGTVQTSPGTTATMQLPLFGLQTLKSAMQQHWQLCNASNCPRIHPQSEQHSTILVLRYGVGTINT